MPRYPTIFAALCAINDAFYALTRHMPPGPDKDRMDALVLRLDAVHFHGALGAHIMRSEQTPTVEPAMPRRATIFEALCAINDDFAGIMIRMEPGPEKDRMDALVRRLDEVIDRTIGVQEVERPAAEGGTLPCE
jgi:hypothetical protein